MTYDFYYWPNIQGRGEFVRLAFEAAGEPYRDVARTEGIAAMQRVMRAGPTPPFAPPFLVHGAVTVAQVAAILDYAGPHLGLVPRDARARLWCHQIQLTITDFVAEIHDTHHPIANSLYFEDQVPEAKRRSAAFLAERVPKYLGWLEMVAERNPSGPAHLVSDRLSTADLSVFQLVEGLRYAFPRAMAAAQGAFPRLLAVHAMVRQQPGVAAYLASPRRIPFNESGIFRRYPELDPSGG